MRRRKERPLDPAKLMIGCWNRSVREFNERLYKTDFPLTEGEKEVMRLKKMLRR